MEKQEKSENDGDSVNNNNNSATMIEDSYNYDNQEDEGKNQPDCDDGEKTEENIPMEFDEVNCNPPAETNAPSKSSAIETFPVFGILEKQQNWSSANPFINFILDCQKYKSQGQPEYKNIFQYAAGGWRSMTSQQKLPYLYGAAVIKKKNIHSKIQSALRGQKRKRLTFSMAIKKAPSGKNAAMPKKAMGMKKSAKKSHATKKSAAKKSGSKKSKNKKMASMKKAMRLKKKSKKRPGSKGDRRKVKKRKLMKNDSGTDGLNNSLDSSDNESTISHEIV